MFIKATAVYIGVDILITSENCTEQNPYTKVTKSWNNDILDASPSIVIGNISGIHFQSILPLRHGIDVIINQLIMVHLLDEIMTMNHAYVNQDTSYKHNAMHYKEESRHAELHYMGSMTNVCMHCGALIFLGETLNAAIMVKYH